MLGIWRSIQLNYGAAPASMERIIIFLRMQQVKGGVWDLYQRKTLAAEHFPQRVGVIEQHRFCARVGVAKRRIGGMGNGYAET